MLQPKRTKFRKAHKGRIHGKATSCNNLDFGAFGLKAQEPDRLTARQIEAARRALTRGMKRAGRIWIRVFPDVPVSKKPAEVRMGSGKGSTEYWACPGEAGPRPVRGRRRQPRDRRGSAGACGRQASDQDALRGAAWRVSGGRAMKTSDVKAMTADQLKDELLKLKKEQFNLRFQKATGQIENTARIRQIRRDVARIKTAQRSRASARRSRRENDAETHPARRGGERQERQDHRGQGRTPSDPSGSEEDGAPVEEVSCA